MTRDQIATAKAIVNIFETGRLGGNYSQVTVAAGDRGHLSYGRSQVSLTSGNLYLLIRDYCAVAEAQFAAALRVYLDRMQAADLMLDNDAQLQRVLRDAGADPVMHAVQDRFFDRAYWDPAAAIASQRGFATALGGAVVYDSMVHGSWRTVADLTDKAIARRPEKLWIPAYLDTRRKWLTRDPAALLARTVYRMDAFQKIADANNWDLSLPLTVRGVEITANALDGGEPVRASAHDANTRLLFLTSPYLTGDDVAEVQRALVKAGLFPEFAVDGIYGPLTETMVRAFQKQRGLGDDGVVGPLTRMTLTG